MTVPDNVDDKEKVEQPTEQAGEAKEPEPQVTEPSWEEEKNALNKTWTGRVEKEQLIVNRASDQLAQYGLGIDRDTGELVATPGQEGIYAATGGTAPQPLTQPPSSPAQPDLDDNEMITVGQARELAKATAKEMFGAGMQQVAPLLSSLADESVGRAHEDWPELQPEVEKIVKGQGYTTVVDAKARNPGFLDMAIELARGRRTQQGVAASEAAEEERQERLGEAAEVAATGGAPVETKAARGLTAEDIDLAKQAGIAPDQAAQFFREGGVVAETEASE